MFGTIRRLQELHKEIGLEIIDRLNEFQNNNTIEKISKELFFCLLTPQSKARVCWENVERLYSDGVLLNKKKEEISEELKGVIATHNKARYTV